MHNSFLCVYFNSLHVLSNLVLIIRRINCVNTTSGTCHPVSVTVSFAGRKGSTRNGLRHRVTCTRCCIDTIDSPDDEHEVARNMQRIEINTQKITVHKVGHLPRIITRCTDNKIQKNSVSVSKIISSHKFVPPRFRA